MYRKLKRWAKRYPEQAFLVIFNTGIFAWLETTTALVSQNLGLTMPVLPAWLELLIGSTIDQFKSFMTSSPWSWLLVSMFLTSLIHFVEGVIRFMLMTIIVVGGLWLLWQHHELIGQFI